MWRRILLSLIALLAITTGPALAKDMVKVIITGPGLLREIEVTDPKWLQALSPGDLEDFQSESPSPYKLSTVFEVYELARYFDNGVGGLALVDRVVYYLDPAGGRGYVFSWGEWYYATPKADAVMQEIIATYSLQHSRPRSSPQTILPTENLALLAGLASALTLLGLFLYRRLSQATG